MVESFLSRLNRRRIFNEEDRVVWVGAKDGRFFVKSLYSKLELRSNMVFPSRVIWNAWVPSKVGFFFSFLLGRHLGAKF